MGKIFEVIELLFKKLWGSKLKKIAIAILGSIIGSLAVMSFAFILGAILLSIPYCQYNIIGGTSLNNGPYIANCGLVGIILILIILEFGAAIYITKYIFINIIRSIIKFIKWIKKN